MYLELIKVVLSLSYKALVDDSLNLRSGIYTARITVGGRFVVVVVGFAVLLIRGKIGGRKFGTPVGLHSSITCPSGRFGVSDSEPFTADGLPG